MRRFLVLFALIIGSAVSNAAPVRYDYHGGALQRAGVPISSTVSGFMIAPDALLPNAFYSSDLGWAPYLELSFEGESLNSATAGFIFLELQTDASGNISRWTLGITAPNPLQLGLHNITSQLEYNAQYGWYVGESVALCYQVTSSSSCYADIIGRPVGAPVPAWSLAEVPVPAAVWLLASGLGLLGYWGRKSGADAHERVSVPCLPDDRS